MLNFIIEDFDVFNEHSKGDKFIIFLVLFFKAKIFFLPVVSFRASLH